MGDPTFIRRPTFGHLFGEFRHYFNRLEAVVAIEGESQTTYLFRLAVIGEYELLALDPVVPKLVDDGLPPHAAEQVLQHLPLHAPQNPVVVLGGEGSGGLLLVSCGGGVLLCRPREERGHLENVVFHRAGADQSVDGERGGAGVREHVELSE